MTDSTRPAIPAAEEGAPSPELGARDAGGTLTLPSGRRVAVRLGNEGEEIVIQSTSGQLEVVVSFEREAPIARIIGARLEIESPGKVGISCNDLAITTKNRVTIESGSDLEMKTGGDLRARSSGQTFIDGDYVNLNCLGRKGYHDEGSEEA